jgi:hypothetical protein
MVSDHDEGQNDGNEASPAGEKVVEPEPGLVQNHQDKVGDEDAVIVRVASISLPKQKDACRGLS